MPCWARCLQGAPAASWGCVGAAQRSEGPARAAAGCRVLLCRSQAAGGACQQRLQAVGQRRNELLAEKQRWHEAAASACAVAAQRSLSVLCGSGCSCPHSRAAHEGGLADAPSQPSRLLGCAGGRRFCSPRERSLPPCRSGLQELNCWLAARAAPEARASTREPALLLWGRLSSSRGSPPPQPSLSPSASLTAPTACTLHCERDSSSPGRPSAGALNFSSVANRPARARGSPSSPGRRNGGAPGAPRPQRARQAGPRV